MLVKCLALSFSFNSVRFNFQWKLKVQITGNSISTEPLRIGCGLVEERLRSTWGKAEELLRIPASPSVVWPVTTPRWNVKSQLEWPCFHGRKTNRKKWEWEVWRRRGETGACAHLSPQRSHMGLVFKQSWTDTWDKQAFLKWRPFPKLTVYFN